MPGPLDSLKDAFQRARTPQEGLREQLGPLTQSVMPMLPGGALAGLRSLFSRGAEKAVPAIAERAAPIAETLGDLSPQFTPVGEEAAYNLGKSLPGQAYRRILAAGGK